MLVQKSEPYYARGVSRWVNDEEEAKRLADENANRLAQEHILKFWPVPITEGRAAGRGHLMDADEEADPLDAMDTIDQYEPEVMGSRVAAQKGEIHFGPEVEDESPCCKCMNSSCPVGLEDEAYCRSGLAGVEFFD